MGMSVGVVRFAIMQMGMTVDVFSFTGLKE